MKEKAQAINYSNKGQLRSRNIDADIHCAQVYAFDGQMKQSALKSATLKHRKFEIIGGKKFLVVS